MSLQYHDVVITPAEVGALHNVVAGLMIDPDRSADVQVVYRWLCYARSGLYREWCALPDGDHLKAAYADEVWSWNDEDLASIPEDRLVSPEDVRALARDLEVGDD